MGDDGISCLNDIIRESDLPEYDDVDLFEFELKQDCIIMTLKCKSDIDPEYVSEIKSYVKENGISLRGKNSFPYFIRYLPQRHPWSVKNKKERKYLRQALESASELAKRLESCKKSEIRFGEIPIVTLLAKRKDGYSCGSAMLPKPSVKKYNPLRSPIQFKKFKSKVELECKIINLPSAVYNDITDIPEYPVVMAFVETRSGYAMHTDIFPSRRARMIAGGHLIT